MANSLIFHILIMILDRFIFFEGTHRINIHLFTIRYKRKKRFFLLNMYRNRAKIIYLKTAQRYNHEIYFLQVIISKNKMFWKILSNRFNFCMWLKILFYFFSFQFFLFIHSRPLCFLYFIRVYKKKSNFINILTFFFNEFFFLIIDSDTFLFLFFLWFFFHPLFKFSLKVIK